MKIKIRNIYKLSTTLSLLTLFTYSSMAQNTENEDIKNKLHSSKLEHKPVSTIILDDPNALNKIINNDVERAILTQNTYFSNRILAEQLKKEKNYVFSPLSLINVLHLLSEGNTGASNYEINKALWNKSKPDTEDINTIKKWMEIKNPEKTNNLWNANSLWLNRKFKIKNSYQARIKDNYNVEIRSLPFDNPKSIDIINAWVAKSTNERIPKLFDELSSEEVLVIINAIYFKENWKKAFEKSNSRKGLFYGEKENESITFMKGEQNIHYKEQANYEEIGLEMLNDMAFFIVMPKPGYSLEDIIEKSMEEKSTWASYFNANKIVDISIPRFEINSKTILNETLKTLGIQKIFSPKEANFDKISDTRDLHVSEIFQKANFEINEEGAEGAAATGVTMRVTSVRQKDHIQVNRPFFYFIKDLKNKSTIFAGYIKEPSDL